MRILAIILFLPTICALQGCSVIFNESLDDYQPIDRLRIIEKNKAYTYQVSVPDVSLHWSLLLDAFHPEQSTISPSASQIESWQNMGVNANIEATITNRSSFALRVDATVLQPGESIALEVTEFKERARICGISDPANSKRDAILDLSLKFDHGFKLKRGLHLGLFWSETI